MRIELVIDELRLHGFDPRHRHAIADAVEREVTALAAAHAAQLTGLFSNEADAVDGGQVDVSLQVAATGRAIARAVMTSVLGRPAAEPHPIATGPHHAAAPEERA